MSFVVPSQKANYVELVDSDGNVGRIVFHNQQFYLQRLNGQDQWEGAEVIADQQQAYTKIPTFANIISKGDVAAGR